MQPHFTPTRRQALALFAGLAVAGLAHAGDGFAEAQQAFLKASAGDSAAVEPAAEQFARLLAAQPASPVLMAYAVAAEAMRATTTWLPWRKMRHADDGLAQIDKALSLVQTGATTPGPSGTPAVLETRFVAANTFLALPTMFNRHGRGEALLAQVQADPLFAAAPATFRQSVQQRAAQLGAKR